MLTRAALNELRRSIEDTSGRDAANEILFRLGRRWGAADAKALAPVGGPLGERLERGIAHMDELGLGRATLEALELDPGRRACRIAGQLAHPGESGGVPLGYLTGLASTLTNLDLVCTPGRGNSFELLAAHALASPGALGLADVALADLLENAGDAILLIDTEDVLRFWNHGAEEMFGYRRHEVVGRKIGFLVPPDRIAAGELDVIRDRLAAQGVVQNFVTRRVTRDGTELSVSLTRSVLRDSLGQVLGSTAILRDISEQVRTESELDHARQLRVAGEMAAALAHQVKNPLAGIYTAIQVLSRNLPEDDARRSVFDSITAEIRRLDDSVVDLLRFSRPVPPHPVPTDLATLLEGIGETLWHDPEVAPHELSLDVAPGTVVEFDEAMLGQVFQNLILNAAQAMAQPGRIRISAFEAGAHVVVAVQDEGPGIARELLETIFDPFLTTKTRGTGLGLPIARKYVEAHGGTLAADPGQASGACFRITLARHLHRGLP